MLVLWTRFVDLGTVVRSYGEVQWLLLPLAAIFYLIAAGLRVLRWQLILRPIARIAPTHVYLIAMVGALVNYAIPLRTGDLVKPVLLRRRAGVAVAASLPTVMLDKVFDLVAVVLLGILGWLLITPLGGRVPLMISASALLLLGFLTFIALALAARPLLLRALRWALPSWVGASYRTTILSTAENLLKGFGAVKRPPQELLLILLLSLLAILLDGLFFHILFLSLRAEPSLVTSLVGSALLALSYLVPSAPGYLGTTEAFGSLIFNALGVEPALAASTVVLGHALTALLVISLGGVSLWLLEMSPLATLRVLTGEPSSPE